MTDLRKSVNALLAWTQEEIGARKRILAWLERQERAVVDCRSEELEGATRGLATELAQQPERSARRRKIFAGFASAWKLPADSLSLSSIAERAGPTAADLVPLRDELRAASAAVLKKNRRIAALIRAHRRVVDDVIRVLVGGADGTGGAVAPAGQLVDAEA